MSDILVTSPYRPFTLPNQFKAVFNGYIYCGTVDAVDPSVSQVQVYLANEDGSRTPVAQPLRTNAGGYLVYNGQPAKFVTDSNHSLLVHDSFHVQVWYAPDMAIVDPDTLASYLASSSGSDLVGIFSGVNLTDFIKASMEIETIDSISSVNIPAGTIINVKRYDSLCDEGGGKFISVSSGEDDGVLTFVRGKNKITRVRTKGQPIMLSQCGVSGSLPTNVSRFSSAAAKLAGKHPICVDGKYSLSGSSPVILPRNTHVIGFGSTESPRFGNVSAWSGFDLSFYKGFSLLYGEIPVLLQCEEGVYLADFDMAGNLTSSMNGLPVNPNTLTENSFVGVTAIKYNKYITTKNVTASLVHRCLYSTEINNEKGNYYSRHDKTDCYFTWRYIESDSAPLYNCRFNNCRVAACSPFRFNAGANNTTFFGGSVEGYNTYSGCNVTGDITFEGTYFETFYTGLTPVDLFFITGSVSVVFNNALIYANNCQSIVRTNIASKSRAEINGGRLVMAAGQVGTCYVFNPGDNNALMRAKFSPTTEIQVSGGFAIQLYRFNLPLGQSEGLSNTLSEFYYIPAGGISLKPLSEAPQLARPGCVFCANGTTWNPLSRATNQPYWVLYSDGRWTPVSG